MSPVDLARRADEATAAWLCGTCGARHPIDGPSYPVCCSARCRLVDAEGTPFVGSPAERLENARRQHLKAWGEWRAWLAGIRDRVTGTWPAEAAAYVNHAAAWHDRVAAEVAALEERDA